MNRNATLALTGIFFGLTSGVGCSHTQQVTKAPEPAPPPPAMETRRIEPPPPVQQSYVRPAALRQENAAYFDFDSSLLRQDAQPVLQQVAERLRANPRARVRIEGNCDERGTDEYNLALGAHRAEAAKRYLVNLGVAGARIKTVTYGKEQPKYTGHDESSWAKNRRDDFALP